MQTTQRESIASRGPRLEQVSPDPRRMILDIAASMPDAHRRQLGGADTVTFAAPSRLHFGLFNESALGGWVDGGFGVALSSPSWTGALQLGPPRAAERVPSQHRLPDVGLANEAVATLARAWSSRPGQVTLTNVVPRHVGLGSKTSLLIAVGIAYAEAAGIETDIYEIARILRRGGTSGIGTATACRGGLVVDAGHAWGSEKSAFGPSSLGLSAPAAAARFEPAVDWKIVLVTRAHAGLHGRAEVGFFRRHCPIPKFETEQILASVGTSLIPGLIDQDLRRVHTSLAILQEFGFKAREWAAQKDSTQRLRAAWEDRRAVDLDLAPLCLSSMGPTLGLLTDQADRNRKALLELGVPERQVRVVDIDKDGVRIFERGHHAA